MDLWDLWAGVEWLRVGVDDVGTWLLVARRCEQARGVHIRLGGGQRVLT